MSHTNDFDIFLRFFLQTILLRHKAATNILYELNLLENSHQFIQCMSVSKQKRKKM